MFLRNKPWNRRLQILLTVIIAFNFLPHMFVAPLWVICFGFGCVVWKGLYLLRGIRLPKRSLLSLGAVIGAGCVLLSIPLPFNQRAASAMLVIFSGCKLLEANQYRDAMLIIFSSYFLLFIYLLNSASLGATIYMGIDLYLITLLLFQFHTREEKISRAFFRPSWRLLLLALPMCLFLFFAFPRFSMGNWNLKDSSADVGFADKLDPGSTGRLINSAKTAFRVQFVSGDQPAPINLYWRGAILTDTDGFRWTKDDSADTEPDATTLNDGGQRSVGYEVWLEGGTHRAIFTLDYSNALSSKDELFLEQLNSRPGFTYESIKPIISRVTYSARSSLLSPFQILAKNSEEKYLNLPDNTKIDVKKLALELKGQAEDRYGKSMAAAEDRYARQVVDWMVESKFRYSRSPEALGSKFGPDQLSEFLFKKRRGFCEHFAASFAVLMRLMGVPARVVVGYQGGVQNEVGHYWVVRQMDAHAWTEIWRKEPNDPNQGHWVRVDPTERIAPLRLQLGGDFYSVDATALAEGLTQEEIQTMMHSGLSGMFRKVQNTWDVMQVKWNMFLVNYDFDFQTKILKKLGLGNLRMAELAGIAVAGIVIFVLTVIWRLKRKSNRQDSVIRAWRKFCMTLEKSGLAKKSNEGPYDFAIRAMRERPTKSAEIQYIVTSFIEIRYGQYPTSSKRRRFRRLARHFSL